VDADNGRMLRLLVESIGAKRVVEVGTSTGYSGLWTLLGLRTTGGRLTTLELDPGRAARARKHFQEAGVEGFVDVVVGDAHQTVKQLQGPIDLVFLDADKEGYARYLEALFARAPGGHHRRQHLDGARLRQGRHDESTARHRLLRAILGHAEEALTLRQPATVSRAPPRADAARALLVAHRRHGTGTPVVSSLRGRRPLVTPTSGSQHIACRWQMPPTHTVRRMGSRLHVGMFEEGVA
jgi:hypothetical protein